MQISQHGKSSCVSGPPLTTSPELLSCILVSRLPTKQASHGTTEQGMGALHAWAPRTSVLFPGEDTGISLCPLPPRASQGVLDLTSRG